MSTQPSQQALDARRTRAAQIRSLRLRIVAVGVAIFLAAWVVIFVQLTTGHDPALAKAITPAITQAADPQATSDQSDDGTSAQATGPGASSAASGQDLAAPAAVTTGQS
jgi:cytoskeletal protein RodZ